jgi:hypothetical protein
MCDRDFLDLVDRARVCTGGRAMTMQRRRHAAPLMAAAMVALGALALQGAAAQTPLAHAGKFGWKTMPQVACLSLAMSALQAASATFDLNLVPKAYDGWFAALDAVDFNATVHCMADDGSTNIISSTANRMAVVIYVSAARPMNGRDGQIREFLWDCMGGAPCGGTTAVATGGPRLVQQHVYFPQTGQPRGWDWSSRQASSVAECAAICPTYRPKYGCKSFFYLPPLPTGQRGRCELHNFDLATGLRVLPAGPNKGMDYYEMK